MSKKSKRVLWLLLAAFVFASAVVGMAPHSRSGTSSAIAATIETSINHSRELVQPPLIERIETELVTISPRGFEPGEITRPAGKFILAVDNRSGVEEVELRLDRLRGNRQRVVKVKRNRPGWREMLDLAPGTYVLSEANHADWTCRITITQK